MKIEQIYSVIVLASTLLCVGCAPKAVPDASSNAEQESTEQESSPAAEPADGPELGAADGAETGAAVTLPSLGEQLAAMSAKGKETMPAEMIQIFVEGIEEVRDTGIVESALNVGAQAIDAELPDANGDKVKLSELWAKGPVAVVWYRGGWCPYCSMQLKAMQEALPAIETAGGTLVAITPELPDHSLSTSEKNELEFTVLSDVGNEVARQYGVVFKLPAKVSPLYKQMIGLSKYNGDESDELPLAATYVIDKSGVIRYAFLDADYTKRAEPADVVAALESL